jgi:hypothetical protein
MSAPVCPGCAQPIAWRQSLTFWNPWDYACPHCQQRLVASRVQRYIAYGVIPGGAVLALLFLFLQQQLGFSKPQLLVCLGALCVLLVAGARWSWHHTRFEKRG